MYRAICLALGTIVPLIGSAAFAGDLLFTEWSFYQPLDENGDPIFIEGEEAYYFTGSQTATIANYQSGPSQGVPIDEFGRFNTGNAFGWPMNHEPESLSDYRTYSYLGIIEVGALDGQDNPDVLDRALTIAFQPGVAEGRRIEDLFPGSGYSASMLVDAFSSQRNSPEFLDMAFNRVAGRAETSGIFELLQFNCFPRRPCVGGDLIRAGERLDLIAFNGGPNHDEGVLIGYLSGSVFRILSIPEPGPAILLGLGLAVLGWRAHTPEREWKSRAAIEEHS